MLASRGDKRGTLRPVELAELNQSELHIASLVFKKRLSGLFYLSRYLFDGSVFEFGDVRDAHGAGAVRVGVFFGVAARAQIKWNSIRSEYAGKAVERLGFYVIHAWVRGRREKKDERRRKTGRRKISVLFA